jgi:DNA (cytosine-5)-methyltransferase 1
MALGLERAGFRSVALVENDSSACETIRLNRPNWNLFDKDVRNFSAHDFRGVDLLAGGVPCPPFSVAGKQLGQDNERDLFPEVLRLITECQPRCVFIENVPGLLSPRFERYRQELTERMTQLGFSRIGD